MFSFQLFLTFCLCLFFLCGCVSGQDSQNFKNKLLCTDQEECGACHAAASQCRWCADPYFKYPVRCNTYESLVAANCSQNAIQRREPSVWEVVENRTFQDMQPGSLEADDNVVQIQPQRVKLSLKPREIKKVKFSYRPARNYPLDLYYLMDLTHSMKDDKETLVTLRDDLPAMLKNLTDNFKLGFGSFADKPLMPYTSQVPSRKENPCNTQDIICEPTYSFKHRLSLTNQVTDFIQKVNSSWITGNLDDAEAQFDALVQVMSCGEKIGWSKQSRKVVILLTDGLIHTAGDGLLGGAIRKNDGQCHLDEDGFYAEATIYDYPSVQQIYNLLDKYKVNVIFAVTERVKRHYDALQMVLKDYTHVAKLESDSSNILKLVKTGYDDVVSIVNFHDDSNLGPVKIKYFTDCGVKGGPLIESTRCSGVEFGMTLNYEAHVTLEKCPEYKNLNQKIVINETRLGRDHLTLEVEIQCGCSCEVEPQTNTSFNCDLNQHLVCGVCLCNDGWSGPDCTCSIEDEAASMALLELCRDPNATRSMTCSGSGDCLCGKCKCDRGFYGTFCQWKTCEISLLNGMECGGSDHGACVQGECSCNEGWSGPTCDCTHRTDTCVAPGATDICSGRGDCECGSCKCSVDAEGSSYYGAYCETCATCENLLCATAEPCVACHLNDSCTDLCTIAGSNYTVAERLDSLASSNKNEISCIFRRYSEIDQLECEYKYVYTSSSKAMVAMEIVIKSKECYEPTSAMIMTSGIIIMACVIAAGLVVILAVKTAQIISDRRAYAKFWQEAQESRKQTHELNPLYISPITEFRLPDSYPREKND